MNISIRQAITAAQYTTLHYYAWDKNRKTHVIYVKRPLAACNDHECDANVSVVEFSFDLCDKLQWSSVVARRYCQLSSPTTVQFITL